MPIILKNNVDSTLAQAISSSETAAIVTAGDGAKFPALGAGDYFYATLASAQGTREIVKVTSKSIDTLAITRAQEGTTANGFAVGSRVEMRVTAASVTDLVDEHDQASEITIADAGGFYTSGTVEGALQEAPLYNQGGVGASTRTVQGRLQDFVSVKDFGAVGDGVTDDTVAIQNAINAASHIIIPSGTYAIDAAIQIGLAKTVELLSGATVKRFAALSSSTDAVFWLAGNRSSLIGAGQGVSLVESENASPRGVVRIGAESITEAGRAVQYCTVRGLLVNGKQVGGQTTGTPDSCIYMVADSSLSSNCYYNSVSNCRVSQANFGIYMHGAANANRIYDIGGQNIGNASLKSAMLYMHGAIDNAISDFFLTGSFGTTMVKWEDQGIIRTTHNSFTNMVCEQGGSGLWLDANTGTTAVSNYIQGVANTSPALNLSDYVLNNNVIVNQTTNRPINVQFPPTASVSTNATTLDDYREGQWTPEIDSETTGSGRATTVLSAWYIKIGRLVHVFCHIELATLGTSGSGNLVVRGLPFTCLGDNNQHASGLTVARFTGLAANVVNIAGEIRPGDTIVRLRGATAAATNNAALAFATYAQAGMGLTLTGTYIATS